MKGKRSIIAAAVAFTVAAGVSWIINGGDDATNDNGSSNYHMQAEGDDRYASQTAADWVAHTDHVIAYTVLSEKALPMSEEEQQNGEGFTPRELTVRIDKIIWSNTNASSEPPAVGSTLLRHAGGWTVHDGERTRWVDPDRPILEPGHSYLEAVFQQTDGPDGTEVPPDWKGMGEGSKLPYDGGLIGNGETEGRIVAPATYRTMEDEPGPATLEEQMAGKTAKDLAVVLDSAVPNTSSP